MEKPIFPDVQQRLQYYITVNVTMVITAFHCNKSTQMAPVQHKEMRSKNVTVLGKAQIIGIIVGM